LKGTDLRVGLNNADKQAADIIQFLV
jgi:hypothetical protein